jgi:hypothetical protein
MKHATIGCAFVVLFGAASATAWAGEPQTRQGFWWSVVLGPGFASADCRECGPPERQAGFSGWVRLGATINQHLVIGWEGGGWLANSSGWILTAADVNRTLGSSGAVVIYYPRAASGWFLRATLGTAYAGFPPTQDVIDPGGECFYYSVRCLEPGETLRHEVHVREAAGL